MRGAKRVRKIAFSTFLLLTFSHFPTLPLSPPHLPHSFPRASSAPREPFPELVRHASNPVAQDHLSESFV